MKAGGDEATRSRPGSCYVSQKPFEPAFPRDVCRRSTRPPEPCVEHVPRQPVLSSGLSRFYGGFVHALRVVTHLFTSPETINREPDRLLQRPHIQFDGMLDSPSTLASLPLNNGSAGNFSFSRR